MRETKEIQFSQDAHGSEVARHPAFGIVSFHRTQGGSPYLFGSSVEQQNKILLEIKHAHSTRHSSDDLYIGDEIICRAELSWTQFLQSVTDMNTSGAPCTLTFTEKDGKIPAIAENVSKREEFRKEFSKHLHEAMEKADMEIARLTRLLNEKKNLTVADRKEMLNSLVAIRQEIGGNLDFTLLQFDEQVEHSINEAKGEIEAFYQNRLTSLARLGAADVHAELIGSRQEEGETT